jgi:phospholipid-binding lipoprotein MlaA
LFLKKWQQSFTRIPFLGSDGMDRTISLLRILCFFLLLTGCFSIWQLNPDRGEFLLSQSLALAQTEGEDLKDPFAEEEVTFRDPLEPVNRVFFHFNDKLYFWGLKPVATVYSWYFPEGVRICVRNGFINIAAPIRIVNNALQLKFKGAGVELLRFIINSTLGLGGLFDPAKQEFHLQEYDEDFGQTLGVYGLGPGIFINWPILGPSSARDSVGTAGDIFLSPFFWSDLSFYSRAGIRAGEATNEVSLRIGEYEDLKKSALDPYIALRDSYLQYRENLIKKDESPKTEP